MVNRAEFTVLATVLCVLHACGCRENTSQNVTKEAVVDPAAVETETPSKTLTAEPETTIAANSRLPVLATLSETLLEDEHGHVVNRRDLHGTVCLVYVSGFPDEASKEAQLKALKDVTGRMKKSSNWKYTTILHLSVGENNSEDSGISEDHESDDHWQHWKIRANSDGAGDEFRTWKDKVVLIDPIGRIRGTFELQGAADIPILETAIDQVWDEQVPFLQEVLYASWMDSRRESQLETRDQIPVNSNFQFRDVRRQSGIRFLHQIVDDSGSEYKGVHYDHGNGLTIADVDGDGLIDVYFVNQLGENGLYRNQGDGTFLDITAEAGVAVADRVCVSASFVDVDNDGDADLYVTAVRKGNLLFLNDGTGKFSDITEESGLGYRGHSSGAVFFDFDRDGWLDLFLCNVGMYTTEEVGRGGYYVGFIDAFSGHLKPERTEISRLYRNVAGTSFEDVTEEFGMKEDSWTGDAAVWDVNSDGWPDLYVLDMQGNDEYYENLQGTGFEKKSREVFPKTPWGAMGVAVADFDNDLDLDMLITDMHSDMSKDILADVRSEVSMNSFFFEEKDKSTMKLPQSLLQSEGASIYGNAFFRNDGDQGFAEISDQNNSENYWPWGLSCGDLNADGLEDAFIASSMNYPFRYGVNTVLLNDGAGFHDAEFLLGVEPRPGGRTAQPWIQVDCDKAEGTLMDRIVAGRTGEITVWGSLGSRASVLFDFDGDGDLDIITSEFNDVPLVLENDLAQRGEVHYVQILLAGKQSNRNGIGALLTIHAGERTLLRPYDGKVGYLSQGIPQLYVGMGNATQVDSIDVTWPSGATQTFDGPWNSGQTIQLTEQE